MEAGGDERERERQQEREREQECDTKIIIIPCSFCFSFLTYVMQILLHMNKVLFLKYRLLRLLKTFLSGDLLPSSSS